MEAQEAKARLDSRTADPLPGDARAETAGDLSDLDALIPLRAVEARNSRVHWAIELAFALVFGVLVALAFVFLAFPQENFNFFTDEATTLTEGFSIKDTGEPITIPRASDPRYTEGITIVGTMPKTLSNKDYLQITLAHQDCQVVIGGREVYNYNYTRERRANASPFSAQASFVAMIPLRTSDAGKPVQITYKGEFPQYASNIGALRIGTFAELMGTMLRESFWSLVFAFASLVLGAFMTVTGSIMAVRRRQTALFNIGAFAVCISLWVLSESAMRQMYLADLSGAYYLTMMTLSLCFAPVLLFLNEMQQNRYARLYYSMAAAYIAIAVVLFALQITHTVNYQNTLPVMWAEAGVTVTTLVVTFVYDSLKGYPSYLGGAFAVGFVTLAASGIAEIVRTATNLNNSRGLLTGLGLFVFLICLAYTAIRALGLQMKSQQDRVIAAKELAQESERLARESERRTRRMDIQLVTTLVNAVDAKDPYTNGHSNRVAMYSREIARLAGKDEDYLKRIYYMGIVHDIGKIGIPDEILTKPGRLTDEEFAVIKTHPAVGAEILADVDEMPWIATGAHWHHERYDGRGYPDGLAGEDIPEAARIIAVADAYDAMTSDRSYRKGMDQHKVRSIIEENKGTQFDPAFADYMIAMIDNDTNYQLKGSTGRDDLGIANLTLILDAGSAGSGAFHTNSESFKQLYQFLKRYARRNNTDVQLVLLTLARRDGGSSERDEIEPVADRLSDIIRSTIRQSDIMTQMNESQFTIILTDTSTVNASVAINRIRNKFDADGENAAYELKSEVQDIES